MCDVEVVGDDLGNGEDTQTPSGGDELGTISSPSGDDSAPTPSSEPAPAPTNGVQATTIWVSAVGLTLVFFVWMSFITLHLGYRCTAWTGSSTKSS
jgi:hypothetical protein